MNRAILPILPFTTRVVNHEVSGKGSTETTFPGSVPVWESLRPPVVTLMGEGGFRALLMRALALAQTDVPRLRVAHINADGILDMMDKPGTRGGPEQRVEGSAVVLAHLLRLLVTFVGAALTLNMVREVWPEIRLNDSEFFVEGSYENTK
jgi:hypothetical protein